MLGWFQDGITYAKSAVRGKISHVFRDKKLENLIRTIQNIQSYFNQYQMPDLKTCLQMLYELTLPLPKYRQDYETSEPFYVYLVTHIQQLMKIALDDLYVAHKVEMEAEPLRLAL